MSLRCCLFEVPVRPAPRRPTTAPASLARPTLESKTQLKLRMIKMRRDGPAVRMPEPTDIWMPEAAVRIPEAEAVLNRWAQRPPAPPTQMELIAKLPRPGTNCAMAVTRDFARPTIAIPHPHEKTGYKAGMDPPPPLPSTYKGTYKGWQQDYYTTMKDNVPYKPLAARSRLPATSWEPNRAQYGEVMFQTTPCKRYCTRRNVSTFTNIDPKPMHTDKNRFRTMSRIVHNRGLHKKGCATAVADCAKTHATMYK